MGLCSMSNRYFALAIDNVTDTRRLVGGNGIVAGIIARHIL